MISITLRQVYLISTFLIRSATSQSSSYPIVLTRLGRPRFRPNPHLKFVEVSGIDQVAYLTINQLPINSGIYDQVNQQRLENRHADRTLSLYWVVDRSLQPSKKRSADGWWISTVIVFLLFCGPLCSFVLLTDSGIIVSLKFISMVVIITGLINMFWLFNLIY